MNFEELPNTDQTHWKTMRALKVQLVDEVPLVDTITFRRGKCGFGQALSGNWLLEHIPRE